MIKKILPFLLAILVFFAAMILLRPAPSKTVVVAAHDLSAGHVLVEADLVLQAMPANAVSEDALADIQSAVGQSLGLDRSKGDIVRASNFGEMIPLKADERALAIKVSDNTGLAGLLTPGQKVGVIAAIPLQSLETAGTFSKVTVEGLRVLYVDPRFSASSTDASLDAAGTPAASGFGAVSGVSTDERAQVGYVILAIPTGLQTIMYDFTTAGATSQSRQVNALEMLAALSATNEAEISLYLMPAEAASTFSSPGLWLPNLVVTPEPSPTPTPTGQP